MVLEREHALFRILHQVESLLMDLQWLAQECDGDKALSAIQQVALSMADDLRASARTGRRFFYG